MAAQTYDLVLYLAGIETDEGTFLVKTSGYYASRVRYHAKQALKDMLIKPETGSLVKELQDCASGTVSPFSIVRTVDTLLKSPHFEWFSRIATTTNRSEQFHRELQFLHRPEIARSIFCHTASQLSSFKNVQFTLLPGFAPRRVPIDTPLRVASSMKQQLEKRFDLELAKHKWYRVGPRSEARHVARHPAAPTTPREMRL